MVDKGLRQHTVEVVELVDTLDSKSSGASREGSSPSFDTNLVISPGWWNQVDTTDLKSVGESREGSNPSPGTTQAMG